MRDGKKTPEVKHGARAIRIVDAELGELLVARESSRADAAFAHHPLRSDAREQRRRLLMLWLEWTARHRGPRWTLPGVIVRRKGLEITEKRDGTGDRVRFAVEERGGVYWLVERSG